MDAICKMTGKATTWPCSAAGCPLFGDCLSSYKTTRLYKCLKDDHRKAECKDCDVRNSCPYYTAPPEETPVMTNEKWLKSLPKDDLASTIHAFHLGYSPWCDHHCKEYADDGCDKCVAKWLEMPATDRTEPSVVHQAESSKETTTLKHLSQVKHGEIILLNGDQYVAHTDARQDMSHPDKEWHVEVRSLESGLYECLYENSFFDGMATIVTGEREAL